MLMGVSAQFLDLPEAEELRLNPAAWSRRTTQDVHEYILSVFAVDAQEDMAGRACLVFP